MKRSDNRCIKFQICCALLLSIAFRLQRVALMWLIASIPITCIGNLHLLKKKMNNEEIKRLEQAFTRMLTNVEGPNLQGDELDDLRLQRYVDRVCLAFGFGRSCEAASFIEASKAIATALKPIDE